MYCKKKIKSGYNQSFDDDCSGNIRPCSLFSFIVVVVVVVCVVIDIACIISSCNNSGLVNIFVDFDTNRNELRTSIFLVVMILN